ncbi:MAG: hypothetical protein ABIU29_04555 [Chthoniobacterales bacterium]
MSFIFRWIFRLIVLKAGYSLLNRFVGSSGGKPGPSRVQARGPRTY